MRILLSIVLVAGFNSIFGQVSNNNIDARIALGIDGEVFTSTTAQSNVEWQCISKSLTNQCLVYHNDQWFSFEAAVNGRYFLNITGQQCRDKKGIQVLLIEGDPCKTQTYRLLKCVSKLPSEDTYVVLDGIRSGISYLINIDGFLGSRACTSSQWVPGYLYIGWS